MTHRARKRFGQNFLHDPGVIQRIVQAVAPRPQDHIVEIGPGQAAITRPLLASGCRLTAIEIDRDLAALLRSKMADEARFRLIEQDVLTVDLDALEPAPLRIVGNLPYNISTPLMFQLLACAQVQDAHVMLQREVVDRLTAGPGDAAYGRLSVMVAVRASVHRLIDVGPGAFKPAPKVRSAVARLTPRPPGFDIADPDRFAAVVQAAFSARRKTLGNALRNLVSRDAIEACGLPPTVRAGEVSPAQFAALAACPAA